MIEHLKGIVGERFVSDRLPERYVYSSDMTENEPQEPVAVVMPKTAEEIQNIILWANETKTPLVPFVTGQNVGGLTIPQVEGAVIVDLKRMDRVVEVSEEAMYAVVEPGVTFGHLRKHLDENYPDLTYTYPLAPPYTSVMANALLQGLCDLSTRHGSMADFITGLEVVLPTGELVRVGSAVMGEENWFGRYPLPDLVGLFSGWQGMTGIVTKMGVKLWPKMPYVRHAALFTFGNRETAELIRKVSMTQIIDNADCMSLALVKMLLGVSPPVEMFEGEPDYATLLTITGSSIEEVDEEYRIVQDIVERARTEDAKHIIITWDVITKLMGEQANEWVDFPSDAFKILTEYDGLTWVGTYIHPKNWGVAMEGGSRIIDKYGFEMMAFLKPMDCMHFGEFKFIVRFPKDEETLKRVRECNEEILDFALSLKAIPYKTPVWSAKRLQKVADPGFIELLKRIKETLDPHGIMNPGRWGL